MTIISHQYPSSSSPKSPPISTSSSASSFLSSTAAAAAGPAPPAALGAEAAADKKAFPYGNSNPLMAETAIRFLNPLRIECGAELTVGIPASRAMAVWKPMALLNF